MEYCWVLEPDAEYNANSLNNKHDKGYKYLLSTKRVFLQLLRSFLKQSWVQKIDENNIEKIDKSFILQDFNEKESDLIYKVKIDGREVFLFFIRTTKYSWLSNAVQIITVHSGNMADNFEGYRWKSI